MKAESIFGENVGKALGKTVEEIISLIRENSRITAKQIEEVTKLSRRGVEYNIDNLRNCLSFILWDVFEP
jgi:predicted HTH transcriptional regulator